MHGRATPEKQGFKVRAKQEILQSALITVVVYWRCWSSHSILLQDSSSFIHLEIFRMVVSQLKKSKLILMYWTTVSPE